MHFRIVHVMRTGDGSGSKQCWAHYALCEESCHVVYRGGVVQCPLSQVDITLFGGMDMGSGSSPPKVQKGVV